MLYNTTHKILISQLKNIEDHESQIHNNILYDYDIYIHSKNNYFYITVFVFYSIINRYLDTWNFCQHFIQLHFHCEITFFQLFLGYFGTQKIFILFSINFIKQLLAWSKLNTRSYRSYSYIICIKILKIQRRTFFLFVFEVKMLMKYLKITKKCKPFFS